MLIFCDPTAAATADITAFTPTHTVADYSGTPDRTVHARPLTGLTNNRSTDVRR